MQDGGIFLPLFFEDTSLLEAEIDPEGDAEENAADEISAEYI